MRSARGASVSSASATISAIAPTLVPTPERIVQVGAGDSHTALLSERGRIYACGNGLLGRLGNGDAEDKLIPTRVEGL